jgi:hypothetical protein
MTLTVAQRVEIGLIRVYQRTLSPDHGIFSQVTPYGCKFYPTCSEYAAQAVAKHGVARGSWLGTKRILRCHPFTAGGVDEVPSH